MTPESDDAAGRLERGRHLFAQSCDFVMGVALASQLAPPSLPEIAFAGRSNVGKSSLINALTNRRQLARVSNTPGRTREVNVFNLADRFHLVDLPGYGYARASKSEIKRWNTLIHDYLRGRAGLLRVFVLIDCRHGLKVADGPVLELLDRAAVNYQIVLTKADKAKPAERDSVRAELAADLRRHPAAHPTILETSAAKGDGIGELRAEIADLVARAGANGL